MSSLADAELLSLWERGYAAGAIDRALLMATASSATRTLDQWLDVPIGQRDAALLALRSEWFGDCVQSLAACPECGLELEMAFSISDILQRASQACIAESDSSANHLQPATEEIAHKRLPTSRDLLAVAQLPVTQQKQELLARCQIAASDESLSQVIQAWEQRDPLAHVSFALQCGQCGHAFEVCFDIVSFLWSELSARCLRLLSDVHTLAAAYGWSEDQVLRLSPWRRQIYINMARQ